VSKFDDVLERARNRKPEPHPPSPAPKKVGRPHGKRSDPGYTQVTAYLSADLHFKVKLALLQDRKGQEFSQLVAELLSGWLGSRD
jgi:hypothetical protein